MNMSEIQSERDLPDDWSRWPKGSRVLFGLAQDASRRDLKKAYTKLIRRFKPERAPEQFRRLREAFEELDQEFEWREQLAQRFAHPTDTSESSSLDPSDNTMRPIANADETTTRTQSEVRDDTPDKNCGRATDPVNRATIGEASSERNFDQLWQNAIDGGDLKSLYSTMAQRATQRPLSDIDFARLYWLLLICPELDADRAPCDWLIEGICHHGLDHRSLMLLTGEARRRLGDSKSVLNDRLINERASANQLVQLLEIRWFTARQRQDFSVIAADIERTQQRFLDEPHEWQRLLVIAVRSLAMTQLEESQSILLTVRKAFEATSASLQSEWMWGWYEAMTVLHDAWENDAKPLRGEDVNSYPILDIYSRVEHSMNQRETETIATFHRLREMIEKTWECPMAQQRMQVLSFCQILMTNSFNGFSDLAAIARRKRPLVMRLLELIREHQPETEETDEFTVTPLVEDLIKEFVKSDLRNLLYWQSTLLDFCLTQAVTPNDIASTIERLHGELPHFYIKLAASIRMDLPIACIVETQRLLSQRA